MSYQPHLRRGGELYHGGSGSGRPKGSRNGFSKNPWYTPIGKVADFIWQNGKKVYTSAIDAAKKARTAVGNAWDGQAGPGRAANSEVYNKSIRGRLGAAKRAVTGAAGSAGNWLRNRARDVSGAANRIGRNVSGAVNRARTAIGNAWDGKAGAGSGRSEAARLREDSMNYRRSGDSKKAISSQKAANNAQSAYDRSIVGRFNNARKNVGNWLNERVSDISGYADRARTAIGNAWDGKAGSGSAKDDTDLYRSYEQRNIKAGNKDKAVGYHKKASNAQGAFDRSIVGTATRLLNRAGSAVRGAGEAISSGARRVGKAASDSYVRSGASNTAKTLMTKGPVQEVKNQLNASGGREAQQAKGNKTNVQSSKRSAQERKQYVDQVTRTWGGVQRRYDMLSDKVDNAKNENERMRAQEKLDKYTKETYIPARTTYNNVVKNKKK